jgi:hypothetical protein
MSEVSTILTNMHQTIARLIIDWKGFGETAVGIAKQIGEAILSSIIKNLILTEARMKKVTDALGTLLGKIPGLGGIFGGGSGSSPTPSSSPGGNVGGWPTGGGGGAGAGAAASGVMGTITAIAGVGTLVSSIIGNFQSMGMNKTLDLIEREARELKLITLQALVPALQHIDTHTGFLWEGMKTIVNDHIWELHNISAALARNPAGGGTSITIGNLTVSNPEAVEAFVRGLKLAGVRI